MSAILDAAKTAATRVVHFIKGETIQGAEIEFKQSSGVRFSTPKLDVDSLTWPRREQGPAFNLPSGEIMDLLHATGERMVSDPDGFMAQALESMAQTCTLERRIVENLYRDLPVMFQNRRSMAFQLEQELGGSDVLDGWREVMRPNGRMCRIRAFPPRLIHILAGNTPGVAASTIVQASLTKGVHLLKMPSNDLFTAPAILRTMAAVAPGHPLARSFSAVYWRGGDEEVERRICRPQFFDKLVAWGGGAAISGVKQYAGPGFELVTFDPKTSISFIGREAFANEQTVAEVAELAAIDATPFNQGACVSSRFQFVEGDTADIDRFCTALQRNLGKERHTASAVCWRVPADIREEVDALRGLGSDYRVWGGYDGAGLVIRSNEPVDFYPDGKVVNVVKVGSLESAVRFATVATSTVGVYPFARKQALRDELASAGVQRIINLGQAMSKGHGVPHDGFWALNRYMRWVTDES